ncbi:MAG TPA: DUF448 domain-containing protein [Candidatus Saccharibacteria bacterium]|nr:DUF448 domain-containing protein [Candidatus Saccharibacteria bacterium]
MCVSCRKRINKADMQRYIVESGEIKEDKRHTKQARGIYLCSEQCHENYSKRNSKSKKKGQQS